jgi:uncharacterized cupin superfamily protein
MERVDIDGVENAVQPAAVMRQLTDHLGCSDLALNYYELAPGDSFAFAFHKHGVQEEVFVVLSGTATWETESSVTEVGPMEAVRFPPGEFQRGWNRGDERVTALALGAPLEYGGQVKYDDCPHCEAEVEITIQRPDDAENEVRTVCEVCGGEVARWRRGPDGENEWAE